jgi:hypothetical protein
MQIHQKLTLAVLNDVNSAFIIDLIKMVCLQVFQEAVPSPRVNT